MLGPAQLRTDDALCSSPAAGGFKKTLLFPLYLPVLVASKHHSEMFSHSGQGTGSGRPTLLPLSPVGLLATAPLACCACTPGRAPRSS